MSSSATDPSDIVRDAEFVLAELARGEIPNSAKPADLVPAVNNLAAALKSVANPPEGQPGGADLEEKLSAVMALLSPVTVQTLRDTQFDGSARGHSGQEGSIWSLEHWFGPRSSLAYQFSNRFFWITIAIVVAALTSSYWSAGKINLNNVPEFLRTWNFQVFGQTISPFTYGAMGACVFLLRSLHRHIYNRTFDRRRKPEYFNRILLGGISGGAVVLLIGSGDSGTAKISVNALGFLAGYNTDLLFSAVERITNAVFPKTTDTQDAQTKAA